VTSIKNRVEKAEAKAPRLPEPGGECVCGLFESRAVRVVYPGDVEDNSPVACEACGGVKSLIIVRVVYGRGDDGH
jgi:hypothetical protein